MEYCFNTNIDIWGTFKALTPYIMGFIVFIIWHWQKGKEVIAKEARDLLIGIAQLQSIESNISNLIYKNYMKDLINEIEEYKKLKKEVDKSHVFFSMCIKEDSVTKYYLVEYMASCINFTKEVDRYINKKDSFDERKYTESYFNLDLNKCLLNYSLYKNRSIKSLILTKIKGYYHS